MTAVVILLATADLPVPMTNINSQLMFWIIKFSMTRIYYPKKLMLDYQQQVQVVLVSTAVVVMQPTVNPSI